MKKFLSALVISVLALQAITYLPATTFGVESSETQIKDQMSKVLNDIKQRIGNTDKYKKFTSDYDIEEYEETENGEKRSDIIFTFSWSDAPDESNLTVTCNKDGIIISYSKNNKNNIYKGYDNSNLSERIANIGNNIKTAQTFIDKLNPNFKGELIVLSDSLRNPNELVVQRYKNNIPVSGDVGSVTLSEDGSEVTDYHLRYYLMAQFAESGTLLSTENAVSAYKKAVPLKLGYYTKWNNETREKELYTAYTPDFSKGKYMNAETGEIFESNINSPRIAMNAKSMTAGDAMMSEEAADAEYDLSEAELTELEEVEGILTREEVSDLLHKNKYFGLDGYKIGSMSVSTDKDNNRFIRCSFEKSIKIANDNSSDNYRRLNAWATLNGKTGEIQSFSRSDETAYSEENYKFIDYAVLENKANEIAKSLAANKYSEYIRSENNDEPALYAKLDNDDYYGHREYSNFTYTRYVNGLEFSDDTIRIQLDPVTGNLLSYNIRYFGESSVFPSANVKLSNEQAYNTIFDNYEFSLVYTPDDNDIYTPAYVLNNVNENSYYSYRSSIIKIDANTGDKLDYSGNVIEEDVTGNYKDISSSPYKNEIIALAAMGHGFTGTKFNPSAEMTYKDIENLIDISKDNKNKDSEEAVTKEGLAVILAEKMVDKKLLTADIYKDQFTDVTENKGAVAIAVLYGLLDTDGDKFDPDTTFTREEAAHILYLYYTKQ